MQTLKTEYSSSNTRKNKRLNIVLLLLSSLFFISGLLNYLPNQAFQQQDVLSNYTELNTYQTSFGNSHHHKLEKLRAIRMHNVERALGHNSKAKHP